MTVNEPGVFPVHSIADLVTLVAYLLGYHPQASLVAVGLTDQDVTFLARADLPEADAPAGEVHANLHAIAAVVAQHATEAVLIGYGPANRVEPVMDAADEVYDSYHVPLLDLLRVDNNRYRSCRCQDPSCCPAQGTEFDPGTSVAAAYATVAGKVALPDRDALAATIAAVQGPARASLHRAAQQARDLLATRATAAATGRRDHEPGRSPAPDPEHRSTPAAEPVAAVKAMAQQAGQDAVVQALDRYRHDGDTLTDDEAAWLILLLDHVSVRDFAFAHTTDASDDVRLWTDLTRRAEPGLVRAPASLLAFAAWRCGDGTLARLALDRALADDPTYRVAQLLSELLDSGISPAAWQDSATADGDDLPAPHPAGNEPPSPTSHHELRERSGTERQAAHPDTRAAEHHDTGNRPTSSASHPAPNPSSRGGHTR
jgi:hypothetical protein